MPILFPSYPPPNEGPEELFLERSLLAGLCIVMLTFGVYLTITLGCLYLMLWHPLNGRRHWGLIAFILMLFFGATVFMVTNYMWSQVLFIDARGYPGGPPAFFGQQFGIWINTVSNSALLINNFMVDSLVLWRCFVIWNYNKLIVFIPFCALLASAALGVLTLIQSTEPGSTPWVAREFATPYFCTCLGLNIVMTALIVSRLLFLRRELRGLGKQHARVYTSLAAVVVDSALPYTLTSVLVIATITAKGTYINYAGAFAVPMLGGVMWIVSMLILLRAAIGRGFQPSAARPEPSGLDFWSPSRPMSTMFQPGAFGQLQNRDSLLNLQRKQQAELEAAQVHTVRDEAFEMVQPPAAFHLPMRSAERRPEFVRSMRSAPDLQREYGGYRPRYDSGTPLIDALGRQ